MGTEKNSPKPKAGSKPTRPNAKPEENEPVGSFEELLDLDPKQVKSIKVVEPKKN